LIRISMADEAYLVGSRLRRHRGAAPVDDCRCEFSARLPSRGSSPLELYRELNFPSARLIREMSVMELDVGSRRAKVYDLEEAELCYAPQFGSAKDPVNFAGMVAADVLNGDMPIAHWSSANAGFVLDVREPFELAVEGHPGAVNIPIGELRARLKELPRDRDIFVLCQYR